MIRIDRTECPKLLAGSHKAKYNNKNIVKKLWVMQHEKCCYCEQKLPVGGHNKAVEHFRPKSIFSNLTNSWPNLLLACPQCNGIKRDRFPMELCNKNDETTVIWLKKDNKKRSLIKNGKCILINPSDSNIYPEEHIDYVLEMEENNYGEIIGTTKMGKLTIRTIGLYESYHTTKRASLFRGLIIKLNVLLEAEAQKNNSQLTDYKNTFSLLMDSNNEYSGFVRAFVRRYKLDSRFNLTIPS